MGFDRSQEQMSAPAAREPSDSRLRVALIDDDPGFAHVLARRLALRGAELRTLPRPMRAEDLVSMRLNAVVIDLQVLGSLGWEYLERTCARLPGLAVIVCTGPSSVGQRVRGLRAGADAWMTKPCHPEEVLGVIEAVVRRHRRHAMPELDTATTAGEITLRPDLYQAFVGAKSVELTAREFAILHLLSQSGRVLPREEIYERVWGYAMVRGDRSVDVFVRKLRQKLQGASPDWSYIHTHFGVGYRFSAKHLDVDSVDSQASARQGAAKPYGIAEMSAGGLLS
jgi:DNA-binding response OmpR family regulator